ncbi:putative membrane protein [Alkalihalobacillus xiaoxiensis]|uniref:Membrane protein n=1 Tax=Shouchella xiaoxiensis TaxID=766895 RepID=A0ABS2SUM8_9BACI|nr:small multi-drug export protein [Shouchella xiaoxiensis]MBM7839258.1 putative membrane protein [Shouchella xiaoxiensis]
MENFILSIMEADTIYQYIGIFVISIGPFFESYAAIPLGLALQFPAIPIVLIAIVGNLASVLLFIWIIDYFRGKRKKEKKDGGRWKRAQGLFQRYGVPGVSFAGPLIGYHIGAAIALASGASRQYITLWMTIAITAWSIVLGVLLYFGIEFIR